MTLLQALDKRPRVCPLGALLLMCAFYGGTVRGETQRFLIESLGSGVCHFHFYSIDWNSVAWPLLVSGESGECCLCAQNQRKWVWWSAGSLFHLGLKCSDVVRFVLLPMMDLCSLLINSAWWELKRYMDLVVINASDSFQVLTSLRKPTGS